MSPNNVRFPAGCRHKRAFASVYLIGSIGLFVMLAMSAWWSFAKASNAEAAAARIWQNVSRARVAVAQVQAITPPTLHSGAGKIVNELIDGAIRQSGADERSLRSRSIRPLGSVADTGVLRSQAHLEFAGLTQAQTGKLVDALEKTPLPIHMESADLMAAPSDRWDLILDLEWLESDNVQFMAR